MTTKFTKEQLAAWINTLIYAARADTPMAVARFKGTKDKPICIVGGWKIVFTNDDYSDVFCSSESRPGEIMCVKVAINKDTDFTSMPIPMCGEDELDDTCIPLEWDDNPECAAEFFLMEWERIMKEYAAEI